MDLTGKRCVITGAAGGIGLAMANAALERGAEHVVLVDLDEERLAQAAAGIGDRATPVAGDVADAALLKRAFEASGRVDGFFANAGIGTGSGLGDDDAWTATMRVNIEAHVTAARLLMPAWLQRGACPPGAGAWSAGGARPPRPPVCSRRSATRRTPSARPRPSRSPSGWRSPTATAAFRSTAWPRWASIRTCSTPDSTPTRRA